MSASTPIELIVGSEATLDRVVSVAARPPAETRAFDDVYREHFAFVWRAARRLGVRDASLDDVVQEVFLVVHRRLASFEGRSSLRTWLFGITLRVARDHRRAARRRPTEEPGGVDPDALRAATRGPAEDAERAEAVRLLHALLDRLDDDKREVFVMAELEELPMPEVTETLCINVNTAYARLRLARQAFDEALARHRARDAWRLR